MMKVLRFVVVSILLASSFAQEDGGDDFQCHILYEYDASTKGEVTSPFYGKRTEYHDGLWCEYRIRSPEGTRIKITFKDLHIKPSGGCFQDKLIVFGKDKKSILGFFCGYELPQPLLSNEGENEIRLLFQTDFQAGGRGFVLQYESGVNMSLCMPGFTQCFNRNCYENSKKCDGVDDCGDGTDEENCGLPVVTFPSECGTPAIQPKTVYKSSDRMVGGEVVIPHSWPWQVSLQTMFSHPNGHFCGGTLINAQWVITASHCVVRNPYPEQVKIHLGAHNKFHKSKYEQIRRASKIIAYPDLEFENIRTYIHYQDIALIKLNAPVKFTDGVRPACLPKLGWQLQVGQSVYVTGWGESRGSGGADSLKQMEMFVKSRQECGYNEQTQICVAEPHNSPCHGDSGGPLNVKIGGKWYVFGALSLLVTTNFMTGMCVGPDASTLYTSVPDKADWITTIINKYS